MSAKPIDLATQARVLAATAKCLEALGPLNSDERRRVMFGLVVSTLDEDSPRDQRVVKDLIDKMMKEVGS